jgi:hypothetical protein
MIEDTDQMVSKLTDMTSHTTLISSRTSNIQDWIGTSGGDGTGVKTGVNIAEILVDTDQCVSKLTDISTNASLISSRTSNIQDWIGTSGGDGTGIKTGVNIASILTKNTEIDVACDLNNSRGDELYMDTHVAQISNGAIAQWALMSASGGAEIDMVGSTGYQYRDITIYGKTSTASARLHFAGASSSGGTFYINPTYADLQADNSSDYHFIMTWENCPFRYVDVIASVATAGLYLNTIKSKHR